MKPYQLNKSQAVEALNDADALAYHLSALYKHRGQKFIIDQRIKKAIDRFTKSESRNLPIIEKFYAEVTRLKKSGKISSRRAKLAHRILSGILSRQKKKSDSLIDAEIKANLDASLVSSFETSYSDLVKSATNLYDAVAEGYYWNLTRRNLEGKTTGILERLNHSLSRLFSRLESNK